MPGTVIDIEVAVGQHVRVGRRPADARSDEDGTAHPRAARRHRVGHPVRARGTGPARTTACRPHMTLPSRVTSVEVGPRDGLQNNPSVPGTADKVAFIDRLSDAGLPVIEVGAFVDPRRVPAMADSEAVARAIRPRPGTRYTALVPEPARARPRRSSAGLREVSVFGAASESFSRRNINHGIAESFTNFRGVIRGSRGGRRPRARVPLHRVRVPLRRRRARRARGRTDGRSAADGRLRSRHQRHDWRRPPRPGMARARRRRGPRAARTRRAALPRHPRHRPRQRAGGAAGRRDDVRRVVRRAGGMSRTRPARTGISRQRTSSTCWTGSASTRV